MQGPDVKRFVLAGKSLFTLESARTGRSFTFRVTRAKGDDDARPWLVSVLTGPQNTSDYTYLGVIWTDGRYVHARKSPIEPDALSARSFRWFWERVDDLPDVCKVHHAGRCGRCGRTLTTPESIACGLGPVCRGEG